MKLHSLKDQRGTVLVFTIIILVFLLVMGGIAIDLAYHAAARGELQRSMDAASLAGAGKLAFDDTVFVEARQFAQQYASLNAYRVGTINLDLNSDASGFNLASNGDIVLGVWQGVADGVVCIPSPDESSCATTACFTPFNDGTVVNAVCTQYTTQIPTSFLRLLGFNTLQVSAHAIATSNPLLTPPESTCIFPIGLSDCVYEGGAFASNSLGCGAAATMMSSSGKGPGNEPGASNTAVWVSLDPCSDGIGCTTPSAPETRDAVQAAGDGSCSVPEESLAAGEYLGTNNGMQQMVFDTLEENFIAEYNNGETYTVTAPLPVDQGGGEIVTYEGPGWEVFVPVLGTSDEGCPPQAITGPQEIVNWTKMVITQVINRGECAVSNPADTNTLSLCDPTDPNYEEPVPQLRGVFGYYSCETFEAPPNPEPVPRSALSTRLRLVR
ncbi:MAG: pilus assembly protein TadG-related protein [Candidatus Methylomirabilales bacterium]